MRKKYAKQGDLLSGGGAAAFGGRWNEKGTHIVYASSHVSLVALEALVHASTLPSDMVLVSVAIPDGAVLGRWPPRALLPDWADYPFASWTQELGSTWARAGKELGVWVPSAVVQSEWNCLINPMHPDVVRLKTKVVGPFRFDPRLRP